MTNEIFRNLLVFTENNITLHCHWCHIICRGRYPANSLFVRWIREWLTMLWRREVLGISLVVLIRTFPFKMKSRNSSCIAKRANSLIFLEFNILTNICSFVFLAIQIIFFSEPHSPIVCNFLVFPKSVYHIILLFLYTTYISAHRSFGHLSTNIMIKKLYYC